jgi:hypothetical protein
METTTDGVQAPNDNQIADGDPAGLPVKAPQNLLIADMAPTSSVAEAIGKGTMSK